MDLNCPSLRITEPWRDEQVFLVGVLDALRLRREGGYEELSAFRAMSELEWPGRRVDWQTRDFVARRRLSSFPLSSLNDHKVMDLIKRGIKNGDVVAVRKVDAATLAARPVDPSVAQLRLIREIESQTRGKLTESGRQYRLLRDIDFENFAERNSYYVVRQDEAKQVLDAMAKETGTPAELAVLFGKARDQLTRDWRPPLRPDGLILLRRAPVIRAPVADDGPALTPSQMRQMMEKSALAIHVVDLKQKPQEGLAFKIKAPDGSSVSGKLDKDGRGSAQSSTPGTFTVTFPDLDGEDWDGDGAQDLPEDERSEASKYKVDQGDRLPTIAREKGFARWQTIWNFKGNAALKELRGTPHILLPGDEVSIPSKLAREAEVPGGTADYVVQSAAEVLRVRFAGITSTADDPVTFKATPDTGGAIEGVLAGDDRLEIDLPPDTTKVHVELSRKAKASDDQGGDSDGSDSDEDPFATCDFTVGGLDPASEVSGVQARLLNLGFYTGGITGNLNDDTRAAIAHFRWAKLRDRKNDMDEDFLSALNKTHGS